ncbi:hypothetical protein Tco_0863155 [Tanacetum coccineum]
MSTQQDIYVAGFENHPPMLNKYNYVPWSSRLLRYAKSKPNGKLIYNFIMHGPYTDDELTEKVKRMEADDQAIQIILMGLPEDIYVADKKAKLFNEWERFTSTEGESDLHEVDYIQLYNFLKFNQAEVDAIRAERLTRTHDPLALMTNYQNPYNNPVFHPDQPYPLTYMQQPQPNNYILQPSFNTNYMQQPMENLEDILDPATAMNMTLVLMAKAFRPNYSTPTNNNQRTLSNPRNRQIIQPGMYMRQERQLQMVRGNGGNQFGQYTGQIVGNQNGYNAVQNVKNQVVHNAVQNQGV